MSSSKNLTEFTKPSDVQVVMTRVLDAPRERVWKAYTEPKLIPRWWGPRYLTTTVDKMEVRPGGAWRFVSRAPDGSEFGFRGTYREIVQLERITWTFEFEGMPGHISVETVTFEEHGGKTKVTVNSVYASKEDRDGMVATGMEKGATETMDRLSELLREDPVSTDRKESAVEFLRLIGEGRPKEGLRFFATDCKTHNPYIAGGMDALTDAMIAVQNENSEESSGSSVSDFGLTIRYVLADGDMVAVYTQVASRSKPGQGGLRQMHLFRFSGDKVVEYWDVTQQIEESMPNAMGAF